MAKTEALLVLRGAGKKKRKVRSREKTQQLELLVRSSELSSSTSIWVQCARLVVQWARWCRGEWTARGSRTFAASNFSAKCKKSVATTLLEARLLHSSETWSPLPMGHAKRHEEVQMRWALKAVKAAE